ncbi:MAG: hypothetical protein WAW15_02030 [Minisyncoccales bacterium]
MKIILFRFEKENIHFLECNLVSGNLIIGKKEKIPLISTESKGEEYNKVADELFLISSKYNPDFFAYQLPQKFRGIIKDEEGFANSVILNLFCYQNSIKLLKLTPAIIRKRLSIPAKEFDVKVKQEKENIFITYKIAKSDKIIDGLTLLSLLKETF